MAIRLVNRQKVLISVINELGARASKFMIEKNLFLLNQEEGMNDLVNFYHFFPYKYGPYSYMSYIDIAALKSKGLINEQDKKLTLMPLGKSVIKNIDFKIKQKVAKIATKFKSDQEIKSYVYDNYHWFTVNSNSPRMKLQKTEPGISTIGYEGRDIDSFLNSLLEKGIDILVDVRYNPFSMNFSFTKNKLRKYLESVGIEYLHIPELGIRGESRKNLDTKEDYEKLFSTYKETTLQNQKAEIKKLIQLSKKKRIALMCFEHSKEMCHRGIISDFLETEHIEVMHI